MPVQLGRQLLVINFLDGLEVGAFVDFCPRRLVRTLLELIQSKLARDGKKSKCIVARSVDTRDQVAEDGKN